ncbi:hypothetical protein O3Q48_09390 [Enterococcus lactis]
MVEGVFGTYETKSMGTDTIKNGVFLATNKRLFFLVKELSVLIVNLSPIPIFPLLNLLKKLWDIKSLSMLQEIK